MLSVAAIMFPAAGCAQDQSPGARPSGVEARALQRTGQGSKDAPEADKPRRLESVTWNSVSHELTWVISEGEKKGNAYKPQANQNYLINMDDATMTFDGETRRFSTEEATNVRMLMDLIAKYAVDSTVWWDDGQGDPVNGNGAGAREERKEPESPPQPAPSEAAPALHIASRSGSAGPAFSSLDLLWRRAQLEAELARIERLLVSASLQTAAGQPVHLENTSYSQGDRTVWSQGLH